MSVEIKDRAETEVIKMVEVNKPNINKWAKLLLQMEQTDTKLN